MRYTRSGKPVTMPDDRSDIMLTELLIKFSDVYYPAEQIKEEWDEPELVKLPRIGNEQPDGPLPNVFKY